MTAYYGEDILAYAGSSLYERITGTSFAGPMVASAIAILMAKDKNISVDKIRRKVQDASVLKISGNKKIRNGVFDMVKFLK